MNQEVQVLSLFTSLRRHGRRTKDRESTISIQQDSKTVQVPENICLARSLHFLIFEIVLIIQTVQNARYSSHPNEEIQSNLFQYSPRKLSCAPSHPVYDVVFPTRHRCIPVFPPGGGKNFHSVDKLMNMLFLSKRTPHDHTILVRLDFAKIAICRDVKTLCLHCSATLITLTMWIHASMGSGHPLKLANQFTQLVEQAVRPS